MYVCVCVTMHTRAARACNNSVRRKPRLALPLPHLHRSKPRNKVLQQRAVGDASQLVARLCVGDALQDATQQALGAAAVGEDAVGVEEHVELGVGEGLFAELQDLDGQRVLRGVRREGG